MNESMNIVPPPLNESRRLLLRGGIVLAGSAFTALAAAAMRPTKELSTFGNVRLEEAVPVNFAEWRIDPRVQPILPDPTLVAAVNRIYSETLARTYMNPSGERIMLSLAYGRRQNDTMRLHQPEGCYSGQGFGVRNLGIDELQLGAERRRVTRLHAKLGLRHEPVTYWMVVGGRHAVTQAELKLGQLSFGLRGYIPDGLLFRVSSIAENTDAAFQVQDRFIKDLLQAVPPSVRVGLLGA